MMAGLRIIAIAVASVGTARLQCRSSSEALLPQPGGFEGLAPLTEIVDLGELPVTNRDDGEDTLVDGHAAPLAANVRGGSQEHAPFRRLDNFLHGYPPLLEGLHEVIERPSDASGSAKALVCGTKRWLPDDLWVEPLDDRRCLGRFAECDLGIGPMRLQGSVDLGVVSPHDFHVLLRHRPRSISRKSAALHARSGPI